MRFLKIIIPMTGYGSRFVAAGYKDLKPFIKVQGKEILSWIVDGMFKDERDIMFICRKEHLDTIPEMRETLRRISPTAHIYEIDQWIKKGPVYDVLCAGDLINDDEECIINYCDFYMQWDWEKFKGDLKKRNCDGCIPCYTGFHPHLLIKDNLYASCLTDADENLIEIREKYSFEKDKQKARHSPGTYYFRTGAFLKKYCSMLVNSDNAINGEYYVSLPYNYMVADGLKVWIPVNVIKFCQWGTPQDLQKYLFWTDDIRRWEK